MSDPNAGGAPCNFDDPNDAHANLTGGTSAVGPMFSGIQALINEKVGCRQGVSNYVLYKLAAKEYGSPSHPNLSGLLTCNSALGKWVGEGCIFHDITLSNNVVPCVPGTPDCYAQAGDSYGVMSNSTSKFEPAFNATPGWDFATGLGTPNVTNLVNNWPRPKGH